MRIRRGICALLLLGLLAGMLCGCSFERAASTADQKQFLEDLAQGLSARLDLQDREEGLAKTPEELADYQQRLVRCELDLIEKYEKLSFADPGFDELAHLYLDACSQQLTAARQDPDGELGRRLWEAGYSTRAALIAELYADYGLPLSEEQAARYAPPKEETATEEEREDYTDCLVVQALPVWREHYSNGDYYHYDLLVTNQGAEEDLRVSLRVEFFDGEGKLVDSDRGTLFALGKDSTQYCRMRTDSAFTRAEVKVEEAKKESGYSCAAKDLQVEIKVPGEYVTAAFSNTGAKTVSYGTMYCVFYQGEKVTEVLSGNFASTKDPLRPGETQTAEIRLRRDRTAYDRFEVYFRALGD